MITRLVMLCCFVSVAVHASAAPDLKEGSSKITQGQSEDSQYFEKVNSFLDVLDDDKKRTECVRDLTRSVEENIFNFTQIKSFIFYILKLLIIILLYVGVKRFGLKILDYQMDLLHKRHKQSRPNNVNEAGRLSTIETFTTLFSSIFTWMLRILFILMFMTALGINVNPLIYGVSFLGIGISFASQSVIKDFINGILSIMDGSIAVGEIIKIDKHKGTVEHITLRNLSLRYSSGELVVIPFSSVCDIINYSRTFSKVKAEFIIAADQDMETVRHALNDALNDFKKIHASMILDDTLYSGVSRVTEHGSHIYALFKTKPDPTGRLRVFFHTCVHEQMIKHNIRRIDGGNEYLVFQKDGK